MSVLKNRAAGKATAEKLSMKKLLNGNTLMVALIVVMLVLMCLFIPRFMTTGNIFNLLIQATTIGLPAIGLTFILITAGNDLSLPTNMACSAILGCAIMQKTQNVALGVISIIAIAVLFGVINGFSVSKLKMVPMIVTLAVQTLNVGISEFYTQGISVGGLPKAFS